MGSMRLPGRSESRWIAPQRGDGRLLTGHPSEGTRQSPVQGSRRGL